MAGVLLVEVLGTALLVAVFLATTASRNPARAAAPFAVGLTTAMLLQFGQAIGNVPFNPARATASAIFSGPDALGQLWLFWVAPVVGAAIAGLVFRGFAQSTAPAAPRPDARPARPARGNSAGKATAGKAVPELGKAELDEAEPANAEMDNAELADARPAGAARARDDEARSFFDRKGRE
jgi:aquaporin Z